MRTLLLAAGFGTRLRPLTDVVPKCLVPIRGRPLLDVWLTQLHSAGLGPFLVNTHYKSEQVKAFVGGSIHREWTTLAHEPVLLGTAGTLRSHLSFFGDEDGMMLHADNFCLADMRAFIAAHQRRPPHCVMSMLAFRSSNPASCGILRLDEGNVVIGFEEKPSRPAGNLANGAVYILTAALFAEMARLDSKVTDFSSQVIPTLLGRIFAVETSAPLIDIGTPQTYDQANHL